MCATTLACCHCCSAIDFVYAQIVVCSVGPSQSRLFRAHRWIDGCRRRTTFTMYAHIRTHARAGAARPLTRSLEIGDNVHLSSLPPPHSPPFFSLRRWQGVSPSGCKSAFPEALKRQPPPPSRFGAVLTLSRRLRSPRIAESHKELSS